MKRKRENRQKEGGPESEEIKPAGGDKSDPSQLFPKTFSLHRGDPYKDSSRQNQQAPLQSMPSHFHSLSAAVHLVCFVQVYRYM